jgi:hypothetical protein
MKPIATVLLLALATAGAACSAETAASTGEPSTLETADAGSEVQGTLNLNIGRDSGNDSGLIIGSDAGASDDGLIIAPGQTGGNFEDVPALDIELSDPADVLDTGEDDVVRIDPEN